MIKKQSEIKINMNGHVLGSDKMFICISARPSNLEELKADAEQAKRDGCEMIEWRVDFFEEIYKADQKAEDISDIVKILNEGLRIWADITERTPMMVCIRRFEEGGAFRFASEFRLRVLKKMLETGLVDMVDIEFEESEEFKRNAMDIIHTYNAQLIYSEHDWTGLPDEEHALKSLFKMQDKGADIAKYCFIVKDAEDAVIMSRIGKMVKEKNVLKIPNTIYALGEVGLFNRVIADAFGVDYMYCTIRGKFEGGAEESTEDYMGIRKCYIKHEYSKSENPVCIREHVIGGEKPSVVAVLNGKDRKRLIEQAEDAMKYNPDVIEWRIDYFTPLINGLCLINTLKSTLELLSMKTNRIPFILNFPSMKQGGYKFYSDEIRERMIKACMETGYVDMIDLSMTEDAIYYSRIKELAKEHGVKLILSEINFKITESIDEILFKMTKAQENGADIAKLIYTARQPEDTVKIGMAINNAKDNGITIPVVSYAMNDSGFVSRILAERAGSALSYFSVFGSKGGKIEDIKYYQELKGILDF
mgnify:CR=1 FL=1